uniref:Uncharacterized protein n=1 Tax=Rhizophora mucronata TaxID=61149 RepID=A0A2P2NEU2_RHIMU
MRPMSPAFRCNSLVIFYFLGTLEIKTP